MNNGNSRAHSRKMTADIVILGAGVMGASIAFHLAQRKAGKIVVIDKGHVAQGGSGRSSALIRMHYSYPPEVQLALVSLRMFEHWREAVGEAGDFRKTGFVRIVHPGESDRLKRNVEMQRKLGVSVKLIDRDELRALEPDWAVDDVELAAYEPDSGYGDGPGVATGFLDRARDLGVAYLSKTQAVKFLVEGERVRGIGTGDGEIAAPVVVAATGPWTRPLFQPVGIDLPIETEYHQVAILKNAPGMKGGGSACIDSVSATYFRSDGHDKFLVGDFYGQRGADPDNFPQRASDDEMEKLIDRACRRVPKLENSEVMRGVTGVYDMTPDCRPLLGEAPGIRGLYVCAGFSGMGFKISPAIGLVMSELLLDGRGHTVDISSFDPARFAEGRPIKAEYEYKDD
ncbi:MAG TPA: FAD-binding oxidoreductase [Terriglobales bacterium]|jgi:sarcosine oxidase subunit beta|nr:FAD-binding oxidoreductase [Terriglobales bacterium]